MTKYEFLGRKAFDAWQATTGYTAVWETGLTADERLAWKRAAEAVFKNLLTAIPMPLDEE